MRNILQETGLFATNVTFADDSYTNSSNIQGQDSFLIFLDVENPLDPTDIALSFNIENLTEDTALIEISCHGYFRTLVANGGDNFFFDTKSELALYLVERGITGVNQCTIRVRPANTQEGATIAAGGIALTIGGTAAGPSSIDTMMELINDYVVNTLNETSLQKSEVSFLQLGVDPDDSDFMNLDIEVNRAGSPLNGLKRCRYKRALASVMFPTGIDLDRVQFGVRELYDALPSINDQTGLTFLPTDFVNTQIDIPTNVSVPAVLQTSNHFLIGEITVNLPASYDDSDTLNSYFGTNDVIGAVQTNDFEHVLVCDDPNAPAGATVVGAVAGRNQKIYVVDSGSSAFTTAVYRSRNGAGTWIKHEINNYQPAAYFCFFKEQFYFLARQKETNIYSLMRLVEGAPQDPPTFEYVREVTYGNLPASLRLFSSDHHICIIYDFTDVAGTTHTVLEYSSDLNAWSTENIEHGLPSNDVRLSGVRAVASLDKVFLFGKAGDYSVAMVTVFGVLGENNWTVDVQPLYPELPEWQMPATWSDADASCKALSDGRVILYDRSNSGYGQPAADRSTGNLHIFDPAAAPGSRWTTVFKKSGIDEAKLVVKDTTVALVGKNYSNSNFGGGPHLNAFSFDNCENWVYDLPVATSWPYNSIVAIDKRPEFDHYEPTLPINAKEALVEKFPLMLEGIGSSELISCYMVDSTGKIYIGGTFENFYGRKYLVRLNNDGTLDTAFNPTFTSLEPSNATGVNHIALDETNDVVYVAGPRLLVGGTYPYLAGLNTLDGSALATFPILQSSAPWVVDIKKLAVGADGYLYVGGNVTFATPSGVSFVGLGRISSAGVIDETFVLTDIDGRENEFVSTIDLIGNSADGMIIVQNTGAFVNPLDSEDTYVFPSRIIYFDSSGLCTGIPLSLGVGFYSVQFFKLLSDGTMIFHVDNGASEKHVFRVNADFTKDTTFDIDLSTFKHSFVRPSDSMTIDMPYIETIKDVVYLAEDDRLAIVGDVTDVVGKQKIFFTDFCSDNMRPMGYLEVDDTGVAVESKLPVYFHNNQTPLFVPSLGSSRYMFLFGYKGSIPNNVLQYQYWSNLDDPRRYVSPCDDMMIVAREP